MAKRVIITGLGPVSALGLGIDANWEKALQGESGIKPIQSFDPAGFQCTIAGEVADYKIRDFVPKSYRKATKVMARDIELAVIAADLAARDAKLATPGTSADDDTPPTYEPIRSGCHIGAGLIACDLEELGGAMSKAADEQGNFDIHQWGEEGMTHLTPLWLLKYLPNMLACHVTILHNLRGPSNTITCGETSSSLSLGESLRVIKRGAADLGFCGGAETKLNLLTYLRQLMTEKVCYTSNDNPAGAVKPFDENAQGMIPAEGGAIITLESLETYQESGTDRPAYAELVGYAASQTVNREQRSLAPDAQGLSIAAAIKNALHDAGITPEQISMIVPTAIGVPAYDQAEHAALQAVFGDNLPNIPLMFTKPLLGNAGAGMGGLDLALAAKALSEQTIIPTINRNNPLPGTHPGFSEATPADLEYVLIASTGFGGQNTAVILKRFDG